MSWTVEALPFNGKEQVSKCIGGEGKGDPLGVVGVGFSVEAVFRLGPKDE